jgi:hypothetical protein
MESGLTATDPGPPALWDPNSIPAAARSKSTKYWIAAMVQAGDITKPVLGQAYGEQSVGSGPVSGGAWTMPIWAPQSVATTPCWPFLPLQVGPIQGRTQTHAHPTPPYMQLTKSARPAALRAASASSPSLTATAVGESGLMPPAVQPPLPDNGPRVTAVPRISRDALTMATCRCRAAPPAPLNPLHQSRLSRAGPHCASPPQRLFDGRLRRRQQLG